jgi:hypothetical protein
MSAHHDDGECGESPMQAFQKLQTVCAREPDIQHDERGLHGIEPLPEALRIRKYDALIPLVLQDARYYGTDGRFIVYYTDRFHITLVQNRIKQNRPSNDYTDTVLFAKLYHNTQHSKIRIQ